MELGTIADVLGIAGALFALLAWIQARGTRRDAAKERTRQQERIDLALLLTSAQEQWLLPLALSRQELTRAEVLGRLGMLPMKEAGRRFSLTYLAKEAFLVQLRAAQAGDGPATIVIPCSRQEFDQFA